MGGTNKRESPNTGEGYTAGQMHTNKSNACMGEGPAAYKGHMLYPPQKMSKECTYIFTFPQCFCIGNRYTLAHNQVQLSLHRIPTTGQPSKAPPLSLPPTIHILKHPFSPHKAAPLPSHRSGLHLYLFLPQLPIHSRPSLPPPLSFSPYLRHDNTRRFEWVMFQIA